VGAEVSQALHFRVLQRQPACNKCCMQSAADADARSCNGHWAGALAWRCCELLIESWELSCLSGCTHSATRRMLGTPCTWSQCGPLCKHGFVHLTFVMIMIKTAWDAKSRGWPCLPGDIFVVLNEQGPVCQYHYVPKWPLGRPKLAAGTNAYAEDAADWRHLC
jgi:hypothetical protein